MFSPLLRQLDIRLLLAFQEIYVEGSLTRAALKCGLTQSALSQALSRLRSIFDDRLFVRSSQGMAPTDLANRLAPTVSSVLNTLNGVLDEQPVFDPAIVERSLRIGTYQFTTMTLAPHLLTIFQDRAPKVRLIFAHAGVAEAPTMLARGEIDLAIAPLTELPPEFSRMILMRSDQVIASAPDWQAKNGPLTASRYFDSQHLSIVNHGFHADPLEASFDTTHCRRSIAISVPHYLTAMNLVCCSNLLVTLPRKPVEWYAQRHPIGIHEAPFALPPVTLTLAWHQRSNTDAFIQWAIKVIHDMRSYLNVSPDQI